MTGFLAVLWLAGCDDTADHPDASVVSDADISGDAHNDEDVGIDAADDADADVVGDSGALDADGDGDSAPPGPMISFYTVAMDGSRVEVEDVLFGDLVIVQVTDLEPLDAAELEFFNNGYVSVAAFEADEEGVIDLGRDAPTWGSWPGVDPDGFWWSMMFDWNRHDEELGFDDIAITVTVEDDIETQRTLHRYDVAPGVREIAVTDGEIVGVVYAPEGDGPFPAVLTFGGSEGGLESGDRLARQLASQGFVGMGLAYFAAPGVPEWLVEIPVEYFERAAQWLLDLPEVDGGQVGVWGGSRGGEVALLLGSVLPEVGAVVADVPSGVSWGAFGPIETASAWSFGGEPFPFVGDHGGESEIYNDAWGNEVTRSRPAFETNLSQATDDEIEAATFLVEGTLGPILLLAGDDDQIWPSCTLSEISWERLQTAGHVEEYGDEYTCYADVGHLNPTPGLPTIGIDVIWHPQAEMWLETGGEPASTAVAARDRWTRVFQFFGEALSSP